MKISVLVSFLLISSLEIVQAQNPHIILGQQAVMAGDFKTAVAHLEKACDMDSTNSNALWMLGYSYYHNQAYKKSISAYTHVIELKPTDYSAYYYRARAKNYFAKDAQATPAEKETNYLGAITDLTKAIAINPSDIKFYQNRGIFYREYGSFKLQKGSKFYDRARGITALKASITDLEKVLSENPGHADITAQIEISKQQLANATQQVAKN